MRTSPLSFTLRFKPAPAWLAAALLAGGPAAAQISGNALRIGILNDQSGVYASELGPGAVVAARMAIEDVGGKVRGAPVELLVGNDQNKPDIGLAIARRWIENEHVDAVVGGSASSIALAVQDLLREKKVPHLIAGSGSADLTGKACSPTSIQFVYDSYALPKAGVGALVKQGVKTWYFITVDYSFGKNMQADATRFIEQAGGKVLGSARHPLGTADFSSYILQAQASGAQAIVFINAGADFVNGIKQAREYGLDKDGRIVTAFSVTINMVQSAGLEATHGMQFADPFYWDATDEGRAWSKRFMERFGGKAPTFSQAGTYSAVMHYLKAVEASGSDDGPVVVAKMKATPINDFAMKNVSIRSDGQVMRPMYLVQVKSAAESKGKYDLYNIKGVIPADQVWRPLSEGGCAFAAK